MVPFVHLVTLLATAPALPLVTLLGVLLGIAPRVHLVTLLGGLLGIAPRAHPVILLGGLLVTLLGVHLGMGFGSRSTPLK